MAKNAGGSATDTAVKLVLIFFISLLSFSVGTYVGKQVSDAEDRKQALEGDDYQKFTTAEITANKTNEKRNENTLSEEEIASLTEEFVKAEAKATNDDHKSQDREPAHKDKKDRAGYKKITHKSKAKPMGENKADNNTKHKTQAKAMKASERLAHDKAPVADPPKKRQPASKLPNVASSAVGKYTVQVASYATETEARDHAAKLTTKGFSAFYIPAKVKGNTWYRVSVGLFTNHKSAMDYRKKLIDQASVSSAIIQKIIK